MSNNADFDALANELRALRQADGAASRSGTQSVLVARLLPGFNENRWREFLRRYPTGRWCALPAAHRASASRWSRSASERGRRGTKDSGASSSERGAGWGGAAARAIGKRPENIGARSSQ